jgi:hypothetical protein
MPQAREEAQVVLVGLDLLFAETLVFEERARRLRHLQAHAELGDDFVKMFADGLARIVNIAFRGGPISCMARQLFELDLGHRRTEETGADHAGPEDVASDASRRALQRMGPARRSLISCGGNEESSSPRSRPTRSCLTPGLISGTPGTGAGSAIDTLTKSKPNAISFCMFPFLDRFG